MTSDIGRPHLDALEALLMGGAQGGVHWLGNETDDDLVRVVVDAGWVPGPNAATTIVCPTCGDTLGLARAAQGYPVDWWVEKTIQEHQAELHD